MAEHERLDRREVDRVPERGPRGCKGAGRARSRNPDWLRRKFPIFPWSYRTLSRASRWETLVALSWDGRDLRRGAAVAGAVVQAEERAAVSTTARAARRTGEATGSGDAVRGIKRSAPELWEWRCGTRGEPYHPGSMPSRKRAVTTSSVEYRRAWACLLSVAVSRWPCSGAQEPLGGPIRPSFSRGIPGFRGHQVLASAAPRRRVLHLLTRLKFLCWKLSTRSSRRRREAPRARAGGPASGPPPLLRALRVGGRRQLECEYATRGHFVSSNARNHRMDPKVPLVIPEANRDHEAPRRGR